MRTVNVLAVVALAALSAACGRDRPQLDDALKNDLALAAQAQAYNPQAIVSPTEAGYGAEPQYAPRVIQTSATRPVTARPVSTARRSSGATRSSSRNGGYYPQPEPEPTIERHTRRDAAIGAVAGAVLGASASRDKVKGGLIGAAAGGLLGAVIGHRVDVTPRPRGW